MNWLWWLPLILVAVLGWIFSPLFCRRGGDPLPMGWEDDPRLALANQRELLLRQIKELEYEAQGGLAPEMAIRQRQALDAELTGVLHQMEALVAPGFQPPIPRVQGADRVIGFSLMLIIALTTGLIYHLRGVPVPPAPVDEAAQESRMMRDLTDKVAKLASRLQNEPDNLEGWLRLGRSYTVLHQPDKAVAAFAHVLARDPQQVEAQIAMAELQIGSGDPEQFAQAVGVLRQVVTKHPDHPGALWYLGMAAYRMGDKKEATVMLKRLLANLDPEDPNRDTVEEGLAEVAKMAEQPPLPAVPGGDPQPGR